MSTVLEIRQAIQSHAQALGVFEVVTLHEPKNAPPQGMTMAIMGQGRAPIPELSGQNVTSYRVELIARQYDNMLSEPQDGIDIDMETAAELFYDALSRDVTLGGLVMQIDILPAYGAALSWRAGYIPVDQKMYRAIDHVVPVILADVQPQEL